MAEQIKAVAPAAERPDREPARLEEELAEARLEVLRLRDLLIGKDAELGAARGRLAQLEDHSQRLSNAVERVQARLPRLMRLGGALLRRLQGR